MWLVTMLASAYLLQNLKAARWLSTVARHLLETKVKVNPSNSKLSLKFLWADDITTAATPPHLPLTLVHLAVNWPLKVEWQYPWVCTPSDMHWMSGTTSLKAQQRS